MRFKLQAAILFIIAELLLIPPLTTNPNSRLAAAFAFCHQGNFQIDAYVSQHPVWTTDWARPADGHFYSNKAPGPILLSLPVVCALSLLEKVSARDGSLDSVSERDYAWRGIANTLLVLCFQLLPLLWLWSRCLGYLQSKGLGRRAQLAATFLLVLGNTAALFMNLWFGHALAAVALLAAAVDVLENKNFRAGFFLALAICSEYTLGLYAPFFALAICLKTTSMGPRLRSLLMLGAGLLIPLLSAAIYQYLCFGSPWALPQKFQNPVYVDVGAKVLWGIFGELRLEVLAQLIFGSSRGLLFTQPWIFFLFAALFIPAARGRHAALWPLLVMALPGFIGMLLMNASFGAWQGGDAAGPRYLSPTFALLIFTGAALWASRSEFFSPSFIKLFKAAFFYSIVFHIFAFAADPFAPPGPLWPVLTTAFGAHPGTSLFRGAVLLGAIILSLYWARRSANDKESFIKTK